VDIATGENEDNTKLSADEVKVAKALFRSICSGLSK
jgi:hypothetical protein